MHPLPSTFEKPLMTCSSPQALPENDKGISSKERIWGFPPLTKGRCCSRGWLPGCCSPHAADRETSAAGAGTAPTAGHQPPAPVARSRGPSSGLTQGRGNSSVTYYSYSPNHSHDCLPGFQKKKKNFKKISSNF